ncbi:MAG: hypothetical protein PWR24_1331 [Desulfonauticus sp.]|nr:hypothetical protein [Desulfonauticus sp.]
MELSKKFLVTVSEDYSKLYGVKFLASFLTNLKNIFIDLIYIAPNPKKNHPQNGSEALITHNLKESYQKKGQEALNTALDYLVNHNFKKEHIKTIFKYQSYSTAEDLIYEAHKGLYDALVLGNRGLSFLEEKIFGSVTKNILKAKIDFPVWVCREPQIKNRDVVICVDGSRESYCVADHVGFVLNDQPEHKIYLLHILDKDSKDPYQLFKKAEEEITGNGFPRTHIESKILQGKDVCSLILNFAKEKKAGVVALGKSDSEEKIFSLFFKSNSVSSEIFKRFEHMALWMCK